MTDLPANPLHQRYATREMAALFGERRRYLLWRELWIALAEIQAELGLPIRREDLAALREAAPKLDLARVAQLERETRHDVVAHLRHFAEQAGPAGGVLHWGATSAFLTDNTDVLLARDALALLERRLAAVIRGLAAFAQRQRDRPCLAYTHLQPAQLTTVGKRACLWLQDFLMDLEELRSRRARLRCRGVKGTTGTQASFLALFDGDGDKVRELDRRLARRFGFEASFPVTAQTYPRKQDSQLLALLAGIAESCHKMATDIRLLQGLGELAEPFEERQVGSSAMAYKRNPVRCERVCGLARRLMSDALNGPLNSATQWLERSLDDSANRRLVLPDSFLAADAALALTAGIAAGLTVRSEAVAARVAREVPFLATENLLMLAARKGGDRQELHERIRRYSLESHERVARGEDNPLVARILADPAFALGPEEAAPWLAPERFVGRAPRQVEEFLEEVVVPALAGVEPTVVEDPRV